MNLGRTIILGLLVVSLWATPASAQTGGTISGRVVKDGKGVGGVTVILNETKAVEISDKDGRFTFTGLAPQGYTVILTLGDNSQTRQVIVTEGGTMEFELDVDWELGVRETVTVTAAAARAAKIVDAPAAVTSIPEAQIERQASHGQVPKVLEFTPGAEVTQSGLYDFNFNTRGFNSSLNRRVSTYIDGRDVGVVLLGAQEWAAISGGLDDVASLEFIRGPSAALYGANASSGVVNITTKAPRDSIGTMLRLTSGELQTLSMDFRRADKLGHGWYSKVTAGFKNSGDFTISRNPNVVAEPEYSEFCLLIGETDCLPKEKTLFREQDNEIRFGSLRFDKYLSNDSVLTFEAGMSNIKGPVFQTGIGRVQTLSSERPFFRFNYSNEHWNILGHYATRDGNQANLVDALVVNFELLTDTKRYGVEAQGHWDFLNEKLRFVIGAAHTEERVDTTNPRTGQQTVVYENISNARQAVFSQLDWRATDHIKFVFAGRVDKNDLHTTQFSPKAAMVYSINEKNSLRFTYNQAFQVANYSEFFLHTRISAFPIGGFVRTICEGPLLEEPVDCGIEGDFIPILAVGNDDLELEKTNAWEIGYSGLLANKVFITLDYYNSKNKNFITDLVPQVGTILGNLDGCVDKDGNQETDRTECPINNDYMPWVSTEEAETTILFGDLTVAQALRNAVDNSVGGSTLGFRMAQDLDGSTVVVGRTYTNVGDVDTQGVDLGVQYFLSEAWNLQASYSWFDFEIVDAPDLCPLDPNNPIEQVECEAKLAEILLPNSPTHKGSLSVSFVKGRWAASLSGRWVQGFRWSAGIFQGDVEDYWTSDLNASYALTEHMKIGINAANSTNKIHRQTFGGDLLSRRALANLTYVW